MADMKDIKNGEEKSNKDFSNLEAETHKVFEMIKDLLQSTTEKEIEKLGFTKNNKIAGIYGDGTTYGKGVEEDEYNVIVTSRPRKFNSSKNMSHGYGNGTFEKQILIGAKRVESQLDFEIKGKVLHVQYRSPEAGFFRGVEDDGSTFMVRKTITVPLKDAKKALKEDLEDAARKEVGYLTHTKLGVEDRLDASTTSIVENLDMKNLTLKSLFEDELNFDNKINESFEEMPDDEQNIIVVKKLNQKELPNGDRFLLFDDEEQCEALIKELNLSEDEEFVKKLKDEYGVEGGDVSKLTPAEKKEFFTSLKNEADNLEEISMSGPGAAGAGGYLTRMLGFAKRKFAKGHSPSEVGAPYNVPVNDPIYQEADALSESKKAFKKSFQKTAYAKGQKSRPKVDKNYNVIPETKNTNASKPYTQVVKIDPNTHPLGMPFVKPNSKEEWERTSGVGRDHDKMERMGLKEGESKTSRLVKRKFISESENKSKGINKRYIVTEKTNREYESERWNKLSNFKKSETIKEAEEMSSAFDDINDYNDFYLEKTEIIKESVTPGSTDSEKTIEVEKPGSVFGITQKFYEKDFLNENKQFILDLNSMVFVSNPNSK